MKEDRQRNWSIQIRPTPTGVKIQTDAYVGDVLADKLSRYLEQCLVEFAAARG